MEKFEAITSIVIPLPIKDIDTDMIIPAQYLTRITNAGYADALFRGLRDQRPDFPLNQPRFSGARILAADSNFGCGSSREHAVWALRDAGLRVVIAPSFADIFSSNSAKNGLLLVTLPAQRLDALLRGTEGEPHRITVDLESQTVALPDGTIERFEYDQFRRHCILNGLDDLDYILSHREAIEIFRKHQERVTFFR